MQYVKDKSMQDDPTQREGDNGNIPTATQRRFDIEYEIEQKRKIEFDAINGKIAILNDKIGGIEKLVTEIHEALNGLVSERGALSRLELVESNQELLAEKLKALNKEMEQFKLIDNTVLIAHAVDLMARLESKLDHPRRGEYGT